MKLVVTFCFYNIGMACFGSINAEVNILNRTNNELTKLKISHFVWDTSVMGGLIFRKSYFVFQITPSGCSIGVSPKFEFTVSFAKVDC